MVLGAARDLLAGDAPCVSTCGADVFRLPRRSGLLAACVSSVKVHVWMGAYGADSPKPSWIYSNCRYLLEGWLPFSCFTLQQFPGLPLKLDKEREYSASMVERPVTAMKRNLQ